VQPIDSEQVQIRKKNLKKRKNVSFDNVQKSPIVQTAGESNSELQSAVVETNEAAPIAAVTSSIVVASNYYKIYGIEFAKSTAYISVVFIILLCSYFIYKYLRRPKLNKGNKVGEKVSEQPTLE